MNEQLDARGGAEAPALLESLDGVAAPGVPETDVQPAVVCRDVHKWFGEFHALRGVTTAIAPGETVVIFGPSGSAKSTFLRTLNRLEPHDSGEVVVNGVRLDHRLTSLHEVRADVGMVFQQFHLFSHLTVRQNITLAPHRVRRVPMREAEERALRLLERVGIPELIDMYPADLSGGQQQRVAIARALAMDPKVLLLDEPTSALDLENTREVLRVIGELAATGMTLIIVTHEMSFARQVADRLLFFDEGQIVEEGTPEEIFTAPREERTRRFLAQVL